MQASRSATIRCSGCATRNRVDLTRAGSGPRCAKCRQPLRVDRPIPLAGEDLDETLRSTEVPVVVDFYADWCGPCRALAPLVEDLATRHVGRIIVAKLDTDRYPETATRFGIRGIPTLIAFEGGREVRRQVGMADAAALEALAGLR